MNSQKIYNTLLKCYPNAKCGLDYQNPYQLLIATILSAQCTDVRVNMVTPNLFKKYPSTTELACAKLSHVEKLIQSLGLFRNKSKSIIGCAKNIEDDFNGIIPKTMEEMITLPGVGRKTANVVLGNAFNINLGVAVDTHVSRLSQRLDLAEGNPEQIEKTLIKLYSQKKWTMISHLLIWHGRKVCFARKPDCSNCKLTKICKDYLATYK